MRILVLIKQVPDTWGDRRLDPASGRIDRHEPEPVIDEIGERAVEVALRYRDGSEAEVVVLTMGPESATDMLRRVLAMGVDRAIHVVDPALEGADMMTTATVLAAAIRHAGFDVVVAGNESSDGRGGVLPAMVAEHLGVHHLTGLDEVVIDEESVRGVRVVGSERVTVRAALPAIISVTERSPEARIAGFRGIMQAKKKPLERFSLADISAELPARRSIVTTVEQAPIRTAGTTIVDSGDAAVQLADFLTSQRLV
ncbi:electron transfer flavoprotein subunit beta/FixA family protein [Microcella indica]|uniref:electron transfer flavoprotein subunit beta/FixA family protein n=1 Tax=Microcella indica TaxID=2750620 RepID=UPI0015CF423B|nr:electron transfer flavoprotein subunit beta/FixA family protein [Microcella indica]